MKRLAWLMSWPIVLVQRTWYLLLGEVVHECPPHSSVDTRPLLERGTTPCCRRFPLELPRVHRMTADRRRVTCKGRWSWMTEAQRRLYLNATGATKRGRRG